MNSPNIKTVPELKMLEAAENLRTLTSGRAAWSPNYEKVSGNAAVLIGQASNRDYQIEKAYFIITNATELIEDLENQLRQAPRDPYDVTQRLYIVALRAALSDFKSATSEREKEPDQQV